MCQALGRATTASWVGAGRLRTFAIGAWRHDRRAGPLFSSPTPARETQHLGSAPPVQRSGNPTVRRGTDPSPQTQPVHRGKPDMTSALKGDGMAVLKALRGLGISESLLEQVQGRLVPKRTDAGNAREKALAENKAQLHSLRVRTGRQEQSVTNAQESLNRGSEKLLYMRHEHDQLLAQFREMHHVCPHPRRNRPLLLEMGSPSLRRWALRPWTRKLRLLLLRPLGCGGQL